MSRSLVLGNGNTLVCLDERGEVRDFYFPYVGLENHVGRSLVHKVGVWADGAYSWLSSGEWEISVAYQRETMASNIVATHRGLMIRLSFLDVVYNESNIFLRTVKVEDMAGRERHAKVFFNQQFRISDNDHADTAYYNPTVEAVIHYKGRRVFLVGGQIGGRAFDEYSIGLFGIEGREGTWRDAEDGVLSKNPIEHGAVDSVIGFSMRLAPSGTETFTYWVCAGQTYKEVQALQRYVLSKGPSHLAETTQDYWRAWVNKVPFSFIGLSEDVVRLFKESLLVIRTHCDNRGGIIASGDSGNYQYGRDTYGYVWPRDAAFTAIAMSRAGYHDIAERFYEFANGIVTDEGYVMQKYQPDRSFGSSWHPWVHGGKSRLAIQEDETALLLIGFWEHYREAKDLEFVERVYNSLVKRCAEFLGRYRDPSGLPAPSYDLWEEKWCISTFTSASVYGALVAAGYFAALLGKDEDKRRYALEAGRLKEAIIERLYVPEHGRFAKLAVPERGALELDMTVDASSFYGLFRFGVLPPDDPLLASTFEAAMRELSKGMSVGGLARYVGDSYLLDAKDVPGNAWFITTLWGIQYRIAAAKTREDLDKIAAELQWFARHATQSGLLAEQIDPKTGSPLSVMPLTWSHAAFVNASIMYMRRLEELGLGKVVYPVE